MNRGVRKQVHPLVAALFISGALVAVLWFWWKGLVYKAPMQMAPPRGGGSIAGAAAITILGREDVTVDTVAGELEPGSADGPGHAARFDRPTGLGIDRDGSVYVADTGNHRIRKISVDGRVSTVAGGEMGYADGPLQEARFNAPCGLAVAPDGAIYVADTGNGCLRIIRDGRVRTIAGQPGGGGPAGRPSFVSVAYVPTPTPHLLVADAANRTVIKLDKDGKPLGKSPVPAPPIGLAPAAGTIAIPEAGLLRLGGQDFRNVPINGQTEEKLTLRRPMGVWPLGDGWLVTDGIHPAVFLVRGGSAEVLAGGCTTGDLMRGARDGTGTKAKFAVLSGIVADAHGRIFVADTANNSIRRLSFAGGPSVAGPDSTDSGGTN